MKIHSKLRAVLARYLKSPAWSRGVARFSRKFEMVSETLCDIHARSPRGFVRSDSRGRTESHAKSSLIQSRPNTAEAPSRNKEVSLEKPQFSFSSDVASHTEERRPTRRRVSESLEMFVGSRVLPDRQSRESTHRN